MRSNPPGNESDVMAEIIDGNAVAQSVRDSVSDAIDVLEAEGVQPALTTVLMSNDPASETYISMKQQDCTEVGIDGTDISIDPDAPAAELFDTLAELNADSAVHGILVQNPVADHVDYSEVIEAIEARKDVDAFHPENVGRLVAGSPRFLPCTPHGILKLLESADVEIEGADVVVVGRSSIVGKPLANLLLQNSDTGNATVTVCHSRTQNLGAKTRNADIVVAACGVPELIDGSMLADGAAVIDVGINRVDADTEKGYELVGDVDFESAREVAGVMSPVPGGVGPMTRAMLLYNTVKAASDQSGIDVSLP